MSDETKLDPETSAAIATALQEAIDATRSLIVARDACYDRAFWGHTQFTMAFIASISAGGLCAALYFQFTDASVVAGLYGVGYLVFLVFSAAMLRKARLHLKRLEGK